MPNDERRLQYVMQQARKYSKMRNSHSHIDSDMTLIIIYILFYNEMFYLAVENVLNPMMWMLLSFYQC